MEHEKFWRAASAVCDTAEQGAQMVTKKATGALETVQNNLTDIALRQGVHAREYESAEYLRRKLESFTPEVLLILGSGLGFLADRVEEPIFADYAAIPHFKHSTAPGHVGRFVFGRLGGKNVAIMQGRMHTYEGYTMEEVTYAVRVAHLLGAEKMIVTSAAGAVRDDFRVGDIMLICDHIKLFGASPLTGPNRDEFGPRFPDMTHAYDPELQQIARDCARELGQELREGVYMFFPGPQFETPAEIRAARILGADTVGMSTVPEVIAANHCGMKVLGFNLCANMAAGILPQPLSGDDVIAASEAAREPFSALVCACLEKL